MTIVLLSLFGLIVGFPVMVILFGDAILAHVRNTVERARQEAKANPASRQAPPQQR